LHEQGEHLLVRGRQQVVGVAPVLEGEEIVAVLRPAAADVERLARQQGREQHLLGAGRDHLLADDAGHVVEHQLAQRQPGVTARCGAADVAGAEQQPVTRHLRLGRLLAQRLEQQGRHPQQHGKQRRDPVRQEAPGYRVSPVSR
jgi:hypothetical protein